MRLIVVMNVFNEARNIAKAIESVHAFVDEIWVFDGAYEEYPYDSINSTDGTLEIAAKYPKVKIYKNDKVWENQLVKRTAMFKDGRPGDYFFKLDGDEFVANPERIRESINEEIDVGWCWVLANLYPTPIMTARIFKYQEGLHYAGRHHWLYNGNNAFVTSDQYMNPRFRHRDTPIRIFNFRDSSSPKRRRDKRSFLNERWKYESLYKREDRVYNRFCRLLPHPRRAGKPKEATLVLRYCDNPDYTFSLMISRRWTVKRYFDNLRRVKIPKNTEIVVVVDSHLLRIKRKVVAYFEKDKRFVGVKIYFTGNRPLPEFGEVTFRRHRIISNWHIVLTEARGKILLGGEDDSLPPPDAYVKLLETLKNQKVSYVQGNIIGRWNARICPAWRIREKDGKAVVVWSSKEKSSGLELIQGVGWYCFATYTDIMRKFAMQVDEKMPLGPDLRFGYILSKAGYKVLHRWDIPVIHFGKNFELIPGCHKTEQKMWIKNEKKGRWDILDYDNNYIKQICKDEK